MDTPTPGISPLRQRMLDDLRMRKLNPKTQSAYIRAVRNFTKYLGRSPDTATVDDLRNYQLHLLDAGTSPMSLNAAIIGLKFFFDVTLDRGELMAKMRPVRIPQRRKSAGSSPPAATSSTRQHFRSPTAPACGLLKCRRSRSATLTANA